MTVMLRCLDCGFHFTVTLTRQESVDAVAQSVSCGQCRCSRWTAVPA